MCTKLSVQTLHTKVANLYNGKAYMNENTLFYLL